jgi:glutamate-ammonia-ligase adenylyltransferase
LSVLADACVAQAAAWSAPDVEGLEWVVVALGKLGGSELTVHSDLDLVVIYREASGDTALFLALQRFVRDLGACLEEPTDEGVAYHIDTRLRPEGRKGALALPFPKFQQYIASRAAIWERLAWTRCRILAGAPALARDLADAVGSFVYGPWDAAAPRYMTDVRGRMERELADTSGRSLEFKVGPGGLADIDFLLQLVQIREGHTRPEFRIPGSRQLLEQLPDTTFVTGGEVEELRRAYGFLRTLETFARIEMDTNLSAVPADPAKLDTLGRRFRLGDRPGEGLVDTFRRETRRVREIYKTVISRLE